MEINADGTANFYFPGKSSPAAPQSVREAIKQTIIAHVNEVPGFRPESISIIGTGRLFEGLCAAITPFLPSPVAQQDWAKECAKEIARGFTFYGKTVEQCRMDFIEPILLRHAPAASGGEPPKRITDDHRECERLLRVAAQALDFAANGDTSQTCSPGNEGIVVAAMDALKEINTYGFRTPGPLPSPAPHLKETGGDSAITEKARAFVAAYDRKTGDEFQDGDLQNAAMLELILACRPSPTPAKDEPKEL